MIFVWSQVCHVGRLYNLYELSPLVQAKQRVRARVILFLFMKSRFNYWTQQMPVKPTTTDQVSEHLGKVTTERPMSEVWSPHSVVIYWADLFTNQLKPSPQNFEKSEKPSDAIKISKLKRSEIAIAYKSPSSQATRLVCCNATVFHSKNPETPESAAALRSSVTFINLFERLASSSF